MNNPVTKIIIADDHAVVRTGLQLILDETADLLVTDEASNGEELLYKLSLGTYNLVILDISMPGKDSLDVLKEIHYRWPDMPVVIFTMNADEVYASRMIRSGASAYISKETDPGKIIEILRIVASGQKFYSAQQSELLAEMPPQLAKFDEPFHMLLTDREYQVFFLLVSGNKKAIIAEKLAISKNTVSNHRNNILKKLNLRTNIELTRYALQQGIIK